MNKLSIEDLEKKYIFLPFILKSQENSMKELFQKKNENTVRIIYLISIGKKIFANNK